MVRVPWDDKGPIVGTLIIFAVPALVFVATLITGVPDRVLQLVPLLVVAGPALYWALTRPGDTSERTQGHQASGSSTGSRYDNPVPVDETLELVLEQSLDELGRDVRELLGRYLDRVGDSDPFVHW